MLSRPVQSFARRGASASSLRSTAAVASQQRSFFGINIPALTNAGGVHVTKYRIVKEAKDGVQYDDFLLALPEKDHLAKFSKETPLFVRYLKIVTQSENRPEDFEAFHARAKSGLEVESDVFVTRDELLACMWQNGYSEPERNAIAFTFPADYHFHYPELSALFNIPEEDTYKFCMRKRIESSHIGQLDYAAVKRKGFIRDHWLIFGVGAYILKHFPFFNYYFILKVFGSGLWCWTNWLLFNRWIHTVSQRNAYASAQKVASEVMDGEDKIVASMGKFANDSLCVDYLKGFKAEAESELTAYRKAYVQEQQRRTTDRVNKQLSSIAQAEASIAANLQELVVQESAKAFRAKFEKDSALQSSALSFAVASLKKAKTGADPVQSFFSQAVADVQKTDLKSAKGNPNGTIPERVAAAFQAKEADFKKTYMVSADEASQVKSLAAKAGGAGSFDASKLSAEDSAKLDALYTSINNRVGFASAADESVFAGGIAGTGDSAADSFVASLNKELQATAAKIKNQRLGQFVAGF